MNQNPQYLITINDDFYSIHEYQSSFAPTINSTSHSQAAMMNYSIPLLRVPNRFRNPLLVFNYIILTVMNNIDTKVHGRQNQKNSGTELTRSCIDVTARDSPTIPSLPCCAVLYPTGSEISRV